MVKFNFCTGCHRHELGRKEKYGLRALQPCQAHLQKQPVTARMSQNHTKEAEAEKRFMSPNPRLDQGRLGIGTTKHLPSPNSPMVLAPSFRLARVHSVQRKGGNRVHAVADRVYPLAGKEGGCAYEKNRYSQARFGHKSSPAMGKKEPWPSSRGVRRAAPGMCCAA